jgi:hypothetical protein
MKMSPMDFALASTVERVAPGRFRVEVPDGWQQGRGAFGGLVLGTLARAAVASDDDRTRALRTLAGDICGPVLPGPAEIEVRVLRRGSNQTNLSAELRQGGETQAIASVVLSKPRPTVAPGPLEAPPAPGDFASLPAIPVAPPLGPVFASHYEYRSPLHFGVVTGEARTQGWVREQVPLARVDAPALVARLDVWWPTLFHVEGVRRPMATISFVAELLVDPATLPPAEPLQYRARLAALHEGFFVELRELWHQGRPVALNQQTFAILK